LIHDEGLQGLSVVKHQLLNQEGVVAQALRIALALEAEALVRVGASVVLLIGASPVWAPLAAIIAPPAGLADAEVGSAVARGVAESVVAVQVA